MATTYPCDDVTELDDGRLRIVLPVTATPWLERLLLRLGPDVTATDLGSGESLSPVTARAARRVLGAVRAAPRPLRAPVGWAR